MRVHAFRRKPEGGYIEQRQSCFSFFVCAQKALGNLYRTTFRRDMQSHRAGGGSGVRGGTIDRARYPVTLCVYNTLTIEQPLPHWPIFGDRKGSGEWKLSSDAKASRFTLRCFSSCFSCTNFCACLRLHSLQQATCGWETNVVAVLRFFLGPF